MENVAYIRLCAREKGATQADGKEQEFGSFVISFKGSPAPLFWQPLEMRISLQKCENAKANPRHADTRAAHLDAANSTTSSLVCLSGCLFV